MMQRLRRTGRNPQGFTLIELIIVIVIIGVLAMLAIPQMMGFVDAARKSTCDANRRTVYTSYLTFIATNPDAADVDTSDLVTAGLLKDADTKCPSGSEYGINPNTDGTVTINCTEDGHDEIIY